MSPEALMQLAVDAAVNNVRAGLGGPFGAVIARQGEWIATGANRVTSSNDPTAHAEVMAIREACRVLGTFDLEGCEIYASCEPCPMCLSAIYWARLDRVYFSASSADASAAEFDDGSIYDELRLPPAGRRIPMSRVGAELALLPFAEWKRKPDRILY